MGIKFNARQSKITTDGTEVEFNQDITVDSADPIIHLRDNNATADEGNWLLRGGGDEELVRADQLAWPGGHPQAPGGMEVERGVALVA